MARRLVGREPASIGEGLQCSLDGVDIWLMATGDGPSHAGVALRALLKTLSVEALVGVGVAGGLSRDLTLGNLVVARRVLDEASGRAYTAPPSRWLDRGRQVAGVHDGTAVSAVAIADGAESKGRLAKLEPATAVVDLESAAWCAAAGQAGVPWVIARAVTDTHDETLPLDFEALRDESGAVDRGRVLRRAALQPRTWPGLLRLRRRLARAGEALAEWSLEVLQA